MKEPSIKETAFSCPHCDAYTTQHWYNGYLEFIGEDPRIPFIPDADYEKRILEKTQLDEGPRRMVIQRARDIRAKLLFPDKTADYKHLVRLDNLFLSRCYNCGKWAVWVNEDLVYPPKKFGTPPNKDLPPDILAIVEEARSILNLSPRGAAALLRLSIQMLCKFLGEEGKDLNKDIANLVKKGLNPVVSKSLDIVRVIGNEAVHPGSIDLNDDRDTAIKLFDLINIIADQMITHPKSVDELYGKLPEAKRAAIDARNKKATEKDK